MRGSTEPPKKCIIFMARAEDCMYDDYNNIYDREVSDSELESVLLLLLCHSCVNNKLA